jgi:prepilin-type N-terminal cleavage/methylation domain-containing protein
MNNNAMNNTMKKNERGFTLIELLVVVAIIGTLSGMFVLAYRGAQQESNTQKTRTTLQKISSVMTSLYEEYSHEPLGVTFNSAWPLSVGAISRSNEIERTKLFMTRERLRFELPDCAEDLRWTTSLRATGGTVTSVDFYIEETQKLSRRSITTRFVNPSTGNAIVYGPNSPIALYPLSNRAIRLMRKLSIRANASAPFTPIPGWETSNANAELLYLIVEDAMFDGSSAIEVFGKSEIGDLDGDGLYEFIDAFGRPICWMRWAAGSRDAIFSYPDPLDPNLVIGTGANRRLSVGDEPYDVMGLDSFEPLGQPLIISAGNDRRFGVRIGLQGATLTSRMAANVFYADPWYPRANPQDRLGARLNAGELSQFGDEEPSRQVLEAGTGRVTAYDEVSDNITNLQGNAASL